MLVVADLADLYAHPSKESREFEQAGVLRRPAGGGGHLLRSAPGAYPATWRSSLGAATAAMATALCGARVPVLTRLAAAQAHRAIARVIGDDRAEVSARARDGAVKASPGSRRCGSLAARVLPSRGRPWTR